VIWRNFPDIAPNEDFSQDPDALRHRSAQPFTKFNHLGLDAYPDDLARAFPEPFQEHGQGGTMGVETVMPPNAGRVQAPDFTGSKAHVAGVDYDKEPGIDLSYFAGEIFRHGPAVQGNPSRRRELPGQDAPGAVVTPEPVADAQEYSCVRSMPRAGASPFHVVIS